MDENNILYVIKMLMHEKGWCHHITFDYDYTDKHLSTISFWIGPIQFKGQVIRNRRQDGDKWFYMVPKLSDAELTENNSFFIFIDDRGGRGTCIMMLKKKLYAYKQNRPQLDANFIMVDINYVYNNKIWASQDPSDEDKMLLYPEKYSAK